MGFTEETLLETKYGRLKIKFYNGGGGGHYCLCIVKEPWGRTPFVRIQSSCLFSESFGGSDCDCSRQLQAALKILSTEGGVIVYMFQEGRGLGLEGKIRVLEIERVKGLDTAAAFREIGENPDLRNYAMALNALKELGIPKAISLATNNPNKIDAATKAGFVVKKRRKLAFRKNKKIREYLQTKRKVLNHYK